MLLYPGMVLLLAVHHQVLCYCSLAKQDFHTKSNSLACNGIVFTSKNVIAGISARSSVILWQVDFMRVDLMATDLVRIDSETPT